MPQIATFIPTHLLLYRHRSAMTLFMWILKRCIQYILIGLGQLIIAVPVDVIKVKLQVSSGIIIYNFDSDLVWRMQLMIINPIREGGVSYRTPPPLVFFYTHWSSNFSCVRARNLKFKKNCLKDHFCGHRAGA